ncbi:hypothetical protein BVY03_01710 [bacterium K02(2017)]|nr:hypothetical protein BVY03_01710 [bacterium K02(2017)]
MGIIQNIITRMATNSSAVKNWCITIVSAILVVVADKNNKNFVWITIIPISLFLFLDIYYLALEKGFREAYDDFVKKLHLNNITLNDLYFIKPKGKMSCHRLDSLLSFSVWGFYICLIAMVIITYKFIL